MNIKNGLVCSLIIVLLTLSAFNNVTAALPHNPAATYHSKIVTDVNTAIPTTLNFTCPTQTKVNEPFTIGGVLKTENGSSVSGAQIDVQEVKQGQWITISGYTTDSGGNIVGSITVNSIGLYRYRLSFPGMGQYDATVSDVEIVTVSE